MMTHSLQGRHCRQTERRPHHNSFLSAVDDEESLRDRSPSPGNVPDNDEEDVESISLFSRHGNVRAQRLIQSIKRVKKASGGTLFWEGWMIHSTDKEPLCEKRYYWRIDAS